MYLVNVIEFWPLSHGNLWRGFTLGSRNPERPLIMAVAPRMSTEVCFWIGNSTSVKVVVRIKFERKNQKRESNAGAGRRTVGALLDPSRRHLAMMVSRPY